MKRLEPIESKLVASRHGHEGNDKFVDQIMNTVKAHAINNRAIRTTNEQSKKETFIMKLRKLPITILIAIVLAATLGLGGISYAAVKLIEASKPAVKESHVNQNGKIELTTKTNACNNLEKKGSERYELKEGIDLSADEASKYINAHCHLLLINERLDLRGAIFAAGVAPGTIASTSDNKVSIKVGDSLYDVDSGTTFYDTNIQQISGADFKVGDEILAYRDFHASDENAPIIALFKPIEALKYYDASMRQNIRTVRPCENNEAMDCVVPSNHNAVTLIVSQGGLNSPSQAIGKEMQGRLVEHSDDHFTLENNGHKVTFQTPYDVINHYNQTTVYGLAQFDLVYANTNPEALKILVGDSLLLFYAVDANETTIPWVRVGTITLMVEREPNDLSILRKY